MPFFGPGPWGESVRMRVTTGVVPEASSDQIAFEL